MQSMQHANLGVRERTYVWLVALSVSALLLADIAGVKLFQFDLVLPFGIGAWPLIHTAGMLTFPLTFILTDVINEHYGAKGARRATFVSLVMGLFALLVLWLAQILPPAKDFTAQDQAFGVVFGSSRAMYVASLVAYLVGQMLDILFFRLFYKITGGRWLWLRATGSTVFSQMFDSLVVTTLFFGVFPAWSEGKAIDWEFVLRLASTGYILKFALAIATTPLIYLVHAWLRRRLNTG